MFVLLLPLLLLANDVLPRSLRCVKYQPQQSWPVLGWTMVDLNVTVCGGALDLGLRQLQKASDGPSGAYLLSSCSPCNALDTYQAPRQLFLCQTVKFTRSMALFCSSLHQQLYFVSHLLVSSLNYCITTKIKY